MAMTTENQKRTNRETAAARDEATRRLRAAHEEEYREYYNEECIKRGIVPMGSRRDMKRRRLLRELAELEGKGAS
jgi:hypothetical protein